MLAAAILTIGVLEAALFPEAQNMANDPHAPLVAAGYVAACLMVIARRRHPIAAGCAVAGLVLIESFAGDSGHNPAAMLLVACVLAYAIGGLPHKRAGVAAMVGMLTLLEAGVVLDDGAWVPFLFLLAPWAGGRIVRSQQEIVTALQQRTRELEAEQDVYARLAVRHERARIARELHDVVSHNLAVMVVQAGAGRVAPPDASRRRPRPIAPPVVSRTFVRPVRMGSTSCHGSRTSCDRRTSLALSWIACIWTCSSSTRTRRA